MNDIDKQFYKIAHRDSLDVVGVINWCEPVTHDVLFSQNVDTDERGYFYAICAPTDGEWWSYYFGMVFKQWVTDRHKQADHIKRLNILKNKYPQLTFHISIGVLEKFVGARVTKEKIGEIEGLLIHTEWHEELINNKKIGAFSANSTYSITNQGFTKHLDAKEMVYGAVFRDT